MQSCNSVTQHAVGQYNATMTTVGRSRHYQLSSVACSVFGLGVDIPDIKGSNYTRSSKKRVRLSGRRGRDLSNCCLVRFTVRAADVKECDRGLQKLVAANFCLQHIIIRNILESDEKIKMHDLCDSVCNGTTRPRIYYPEMTPSSLPAVSVPVRTRRVLVVQKESLRRALVQYM